MVLGQRIKELRREAGWSQGELGERIGTDSQRVSRHENGRITPSVDALVRIAEALDVSVDYLLIEDSPRRPLHAVDADLAARLADLAELSDDDRASLLHMLDALVTKNRLKAFAGERS
ncbi:MAG: helix-turn-helix domain-containing protein [Nocardioidaceae bacterium]